MEIVTANHGHKFLVNFDYIDDGLVYCFGYDSVPDEDSDKDGDEK